MNSIVSSQFQSQTSKSPRLQFWWLKQWKYPRGADIYLTTSLRHRDCVWFGGFRDPTLSLRSWSSISSINFLPNYYSHFFFSISLQSSLIIQKPKPDKVGMLVFDWQPNMATMLIFPYDSPTQSDSFSAPNLPYIVRS